MRVRPELELTELGVDLVDARLDVASLETPRVPRPHTEPVLRLDRVERAGAAVAGVLARRPRVAGAPLAVRPTTPAPVAPWLDEVAALLGAPEGTLGDHDRARLLAARAGVLLAGSADQAGAGHGDATAAAGLFERTGDVLPAATCHAVAALAAVRAGGVGQALDDAVLALVAFGSHSDHERDPAGEAVLTELLGRLCELFFDHDRALQFLELSARALRDVPGATAAGLTVQSRIAELLLHRATDPDADLEQRAALLDRADAIARALLAAGEAVAGRRLLAGVLAERGDAAQGWALVADDDAPDGELRLTRARCQAALGAHAGALADLAVAVDAFAAAGDLARQIAALRLRSAVREAIGDAAGALADARTLADLVWQRHRRQVGGFMDQVWSRAGVEGQRRDLEARARVLLRFAEQDPLTGLANRRAVERFCAAMRQHEQICLVLVDVDHFKDVNDRHGHIVGDVVLREVAAVLASSVRSVDRVARWGGEEFLVALPGGSALLGAEAADRLRRRIEGHAWTAHAAGLRLTVSAGVSAGPAGQFPTVLARADAAVYAAKRAGRNRVVSS